MKPQKINIILLILFFILSGLKTINYNKPSAINMALVICQIVILAVMAKFEQRKWVRVAFLVAIAILSVSTYLQFTWG
jgi:hypothetical protein